MNILRKALDWARGRDDAAEPEILSDRTYVPDAPGPPSFTGKRPTKRDMSLTGDAFLVKRKLGASWFCRRLAPRTRRRRWAELSADERALARSAGWNVK